MDELCCNMEELCGTAPYQTKPAVGSSGQPGMDTSAITNKGGTTFEMLEERRGSAIPW